MPVILRWFLRLGPTNPIAVRLVQNGSRRTKHLYIRGIYLAALVLLLLWSLLLVGSGEASYRELAAQGARSFVWVAYLQIALICILAPVFMAGAIAQEANPRTWEVLLTTPLSRAEIVLGNLFGRLFFILALLLASLPLFALTQYFGGVPGRSIFTSYLIAGCAALLVGSVAIALSVSRLVGKRAVFTFYIAVVSYLAVTGAVDAYLKAAGLGAGGGRGVTWMTAINPFLSLHALLNPSTYPRAEAGTQAGLARWFLERPVPTWCWGSSLLSGLLILASTLTVRSGGLGTIGGRSSSLPWYRRMLKLGARGYEHRPPRAVWTNPIAWREASARNATLGRIAARWSFIAIGGLWAVGLMAFYHGGSLQPSSFQLALVTTVWAEVGVTALVAINMAATAISREREDGTLDLLLTTPLTPSLYLTGKLRGLIAYLAPMLAVPLFTLLLAGGYALADGAGGSGPASMRVAAGGATVTAPVVLPEAGIVAAVVFLPFIAVSVMAGLHWSLKSKGTLSSVISAVGVVGTVSLLVGLCGWHSGSQISTLGPVLAAASPASLVSCLVHPAEAMSDTVASGGGLEAARVALAVGALIAAVAYGLIVYSVHAYMVRNFDATVRKLAGIR